MERIFTIDFTKSFIDELAAYIEREYIVKGRSLERLAIVFGGKRPAHFLKRALARRIKKAFVPPRIYTQEELIDEIASVSGVRRSAGELEDCFEIYRLAGRLTPRLLDGREDFSRFLPWASDILDFIGQLDLEDVGEDALKNLQDSARIGFSVPENINTLLENVMVLRRAFHERAVERGTTSRGLQYLRARENVSQWDASRYDEVIFANFFYFHRTEEAVVKHLYAAGKATLVFQGDQRKWDVLDHMAGRFGCELKEGPVPVRTDFKLEAYSAFDVHSQAAVVRDILARIPDR